MPGSIPVNPSAEAPRSAVERPANINVRLGFASEPALEPDLPICDSHQHFFDRRQGFYPYHTYLIPEFIADVESSGHNVRSTVWAEARWMYRAHGPEEMRCVGEVEFAQGQAAASASGLYGSCAAAVAIVGHANLALGEKVEPVLDALRAASPNRFRGIRHSVLWDPHPEFESRTERGVLASSAFRAGARILARKGLSYDAWLNFTQMPELAELARALPDLTIILNHLGGLIRVGPYANRDAEIFEIWLNGMTMLAECPNVTVKIGGLGMPRVGFGWNARTEPATSEEMSAAIAPYVQRCIDLFGPDRCMFESNFPTDKVSYSYNVIYNAFKRVSAGYSPTERAALFHDTAVRIYRIDSGAEV